MISPDTNLYIYEIKGDLENRTHQSPSSFIGLWNEDDFSYLFFSSPEEEFVTNLLLLTNASFIARHEMKYLGLAGRAPGYGTHHPRHNV